MGVEQRRIYRLEPEDDISDLMTILRTTPETAVIFVDQPGVSVVRNEINLRLLLGYARDGDRQLIMVTTDPLLQRLCARTGIRCFPTEAEALAESGTVLSFDAAGASGEDELKIGKARLASTADAAGKEDRGGKLQRKPAFNRFVALIIAIIALGLLYYIFTPKVTVVVTPRLSIFRQTVKMMGVPPESRQEAAEKPILPLKPVEAVIETQADVFTTGSQVVGTERARGVVVFLNEGEKPVVVPAGTIMTTAGGVQYKTEKAVTVPARKTEYFLDVPAGIAAGRAEVSIVALEAGVSGNVAAGRVRRFADPGFNRQLTVRNPEAIGGGAERRQSIVSEEDLERAEAICQQRAVLQAGKILQSRAADRDNVLIPESVQVERIERQSTVEAGAEAREVTVMTRFRATGMAFARQDLGQVLKDEITRHLPEDMALYRRKFEVESLKAALTDTGNVQLEARVSAAVYRRLSTTELVAALAGLSRQDVESIARAVALEKIEIMPDNVARLPRFRHWIRVEVDLPPSAVAVQWSSFAE